MAEKKQSILDKKIEWKYEKQFIVLATCMIYHWFSLYLYDLEDKIKTIFWTRVADVGLRLLLVIPLVFAYFKIGVYKEIKIDWKNKKQYVWAFVLLIPLLLVYYIQYGYSVENLFRFRIIHMSFGESAYRFFYYVVLVAMIEEFKYRVYIQGEMSMLLGKVRMLAPLLAGIYFGYCHIVQGTPLQVRLCIGVGIILGYAKQYIKDCTVVTIVLAHAMYDMFIFFVFAG